MASSITATPLVLELGASLQDSPSLSQRESANFLPIVSEKTDQKNLSKASEPLWPATSCRSAQMSQRYFPST
jgi:hypothetical protein